MPKYINEFGNYADSHFDYLSEDDYNYYTSFLKDIDKDMEQLLVIPTEISMVYCYMPIPGKGKESIDLVRKAIQILKANNIEPPDPEKVAFSSFSEKNGWGNNFDGAPLSITLNPKD